MEINIRVKGATAEREIADDLNYIISIVYKELEIPSSTWYVVQRNQNQTAVGGKDLTGTFGLAIEVKRQEALSINSWWTQCTASAKAHGELPVLLFRQSKQKWRCITLLELGLPGANHASMTVRAEIDYETFKVWFKAWVKRSIQGQPTEIDVKHPSVWDPYDE